MSEDIHKWTDGRYALMFDEHTFFVWDNEMEERMTALNVTKKLNEQQATIEELKEENSNLNSILNEVGLQKPFIKILDDYMIEYDGSCFSMHKPSDIRSFVYLMNRNNNFDELQCEYNDESMVIDDE